MLHIRGSKEDRFRGLPVERSHGEVIVVSLPDSELFFKVSKAVELVTSVEFFIVLSVTAFYLAVMSGRIRPD